MGKRKVYMIIKTKAYKIKKILKTKSARKRKKGRNKKT